MMTQPLSLTTCYGLIRPSRLCFDTVTKTKTWVDNENVTYTDLNGNFDTLYNDYNGNIANANIASDAAIAESKIAFNTSTGHNHDGSNSKLIPAVVGIPVTGSLVVSTDPAFWIPIRDSRTISEAYAVVKTAPTGADLIIDIEKSTDDGETWTSIWNTTTQNRLTIADGETTGEQTSFDTTSLSEDDLLRIAIDQVGSSVAGSDLTVTIKI